jgi:hypothetical protein
MNNKVGKIDWNIESEKSAVDGDNVPATESEVDVEKIWKLIWSSGCLPVVMNKMWTHWF